MDTFIWLFLGLLLGLIFVSIARKQGRGEKPLLAKGLVVAAFLYVLFAVFGNVDITWLAIEVAGVIVFTTMAWAGIQYSVWWLVVGWATHVIWDVGLHLVGDGAAFTPGWYPLLCITFDLVLAVYIVFFTNRMATSLELE